MANFAWAESHIDWFMRTFDMDKRELSAGDVEKRYRPKKGEPKKGKPKGDEQTIDMQDFRNLMRLMVLNEHARVIRSSVYDKGYKIRIVSAEYPYIQEIFDDEIFSHPFMSEPLPEPKVLLNTYLPTLKAWSELHEAAWFGNFNRGLRFVDAFHMYNYLGGDFDNIFYLFPEFEGEGKELFILNVMYFIATYKAFKIGASELKADVDAHSKHPNPVDHNTFFIQIFRSYIIKNFLLTLETKDISFSHRSASNNFDCILKYYTSGQKIPPGLFAPFDKIFQPSNELDYRNAMECQWFKILEKSTNPAVRKAAQTAEEAFQDIANFHLTRYNRTRLK